jgi:segregation and condensation protein A
MEKTKHEENKVDVEQALITETDEPDDVSPLSGYKVKLEAFEGPFDLLLHMIDEGKVDVYMVSLTQIVRGFVDYIKKMKDLDITVASEFLVMAAYLIEMKSRMLLPVSADPIEDSGIEDIEKTLLDRLHEYKVFKELAERLRKRKEAFGRGYTRHVDEEPVFEEDREVFLADVTLRDLVSAFQKVWKIADAAVESREIIDDVVTLPGKIQFILDKISRMPDGVPFEALFTRLVKIEVVVTFLAILELARQRRIAIRQGGAYGSILIFGRGEAAN